MVVIKFGNFVLFGILYFDKSNIGFFRCLINGVR